MKAKITTTKGETTYHIKNHSDLVQLVNRYFDFKPSKERWWHKLLGVMPNNKTAIINNYSHCIVTCYGYEVYKELQKHLREKKRDEVVVYISASYDEAMEKLIEI